MDLVFANEAFNMGPPIGGQVKFENSEERVNCPEIMKKQYAEYRK